MCSAMETIGEVGEASEATGRLPIRSSKINDAESQDSSRRKLNSEPSIFSEDKEERVRARRLRIKRRLEEEKRMTNKEEGIEGAVLEDSPKQERISLKQVEKSKFELKRLSYENNQLVRDVIIAGDGREMMRRRGEDDNLRTRTEKLEAEANTGKERFDEIAKRWETSITKNLPQELQDMLNQQRAEYEEMINEKNRLIKEFESELKIKDDQYVKDLKQQAGDVDLLLERMEDQSRTLARAYKKEIKEIENIYSRERKQLVATECSEDKQITDGRRNIELDYMKEYQKLIEESDKQLDELLTNGDEDYRNTKIQLENDIQFLQRQLEQMKATFHLNIEKLEYNFQVVKKRDEENKKTENQQKRKISRLQDQYNNQRSRLKQQESKCSQDLSSLSEEYQKVANQLKDLQLKLNYFQETDEKKFSDVWTMSEEEIRGLVKDVLKTDEIIHSQQLGVDWTSSVIPESIHKVHPPEQVMSATQIAQEVFSSTSVSSSQESLMSEYDRRRSGLEAGEQEEGFFGVGQLGVYPTIFVRKAMEMISEEGDFLVEEKLNMLLGPLDKEEQILMKLDAIFQSLEIENEQDIIQLLQYVILTIEDGSIKSGGQNFEIIQPDMVSQALRSYIETKKEKEVGCPVKVTSRVDKERERKEVLDSDYWNQMANILPPMHECLWNSLQDGLTSYSLELDKRERLIEETDSLQLQNTELKMLLQQYLDAQVNQELLQPPVQMLAFN